ncbi:hypothetical protein Btru_005439 [Bulinus truncatus]|nr:hypothetical protein Btru_005439 [Bulinus truncatus]
MYPSDSYPSYPSETFSSIPLTSTPSYSSVSASTPGSVTFTFSSSITPSLPFSFSTSPLPEYCILGTEEVREALQFLPLNYTLGITEHNITVYYGENGDFIEDGVLVIGSCYVCYCSGNKLKCEVSNCELCPNSSIECKGDCYSSHTVQTFSDVGVPDYCLNDSKPCIPESCTTPHTCPETWSSWSSCTGSCQQSRYRSCGPECGDDCNSFNLTETQSCHDCTTTAITPECPDNQVPACVSKYDACIESCAVYRKNSTCDALLDDDTCIDNCKCKEGYKSNIFGECVLEAQCECYDSHNSSTPILPTFTVNISKCVTCECREDGYKCKETDNCCEWTTWTEWSQCSTTCGNGKRTRTRKSYGNGCPVEEPTIETQDCKLSECPCIHNGEIWESGKVVKDRCEECTCHDGNIACNQFTNIGNETWSDAGCSKKCFCNVNGSMECIDSPELQQCQEVINQCNLTTHVLEETGDDCCKKCTPKMIPCRYNADGFVKLNVTRTDHGFCSSGQLEVGSCLGTCGFSTEVFDSTEFVDDTFKLVTKQSCSCCKAKVDTKSVPFLCDNGSNVNYTVSYISGCSCFECQCKKFTVKQLETQVTEFNLKHLLNYILKRNL